MVVGAYPPSKCGVGDYTDRLCQALALHGMEIHAITSYSENNKYDNIGSIKVYPVIEKWDFSARNKIDELIGSIKPDILHIQYPSDEYGKSTFINFLPMLMKRKHKLKVVETVHEYMNYTSKGKLRNVVNYKASDAIIVVEKRYITEIKGFLSLISKSLNIQYIPISSNIPKINIDNTERDHIRNKLGVNKEEILISYFGFVNMQKGFEVLLEALKKLKSKNVKLRLLCIGELNLDNEYHASIRGLIAGLHLEDNIIFTGFIEEPSTVARYLSATDVCVLPFAEGVSERNGSFLAAANQDIPIITTTRDIQESPAFNNVYYVPINNSDAIVEKIVQMDKSSSISKRNVVISWDEIAERTLALYEKILRK